MHPLVGLLLIAAAVASAVSAEEAAEQNSVVVANDGQDNFLILNDDEVKANPQLLAFLEQANKAEVEELVDQNTKLQNAILERIRSAVEARRANKRHPDTKQAESPDLPTDESLEGQKTSEPSKSPPLGMPAEVEENDDDDERVMNRLKVAKLKADVKKNALKIYKIGAGLKGKLAKFLKKSKLKGKAVKKAAAWPVVHYSVAAN